jgi:hypothetical protein
MLWNRRSDSVCELSATLRAPNLDPPATAGRQLHGAVRHMGSSFCRIAKARASGLTSAPG